MRAAIYARYSSENQRPESIEDQVGSCRKLAAARGFTVAATNIFTDQAASGARSDRKGLAALLVAAKAKEFEILLVDDLSRLARDNLLMLTTIAELHFNGIKVVSVADGLDTSDSEAKLGIQIRGIFNELQLEDLRKKTLRGQLGQKQRGFIVGEGTFGYKSQPVGEGRLDKNGRPRPDGYRMAVEPGEAAIVLRIFREFVECQAASGIVRRLNQEGVPGRRRRRGCWSPSTVGRILTNQKYTGIWTWNKTQSRRDPRSGMPRQFPKAATEWITSRDESLRIVPQELWDRAQMRIRAVRKVWPGGQGKPGFQGQLQSRVAVYPHELLSGAMECACCGAAIVKVSGKSGGYYGCLGAKKGACGNKVLVRRTVAESVIIGAVQGKLSSRENLSYICERIWRMVREKGSAAPQAIRMKQTELDAEERRVTNFVEFIAEERWSRGLAGALALAERKVDFLRVELAALQDARVEIFAAPPRHWVEERTQRLQEALERRTGASAILLRNLLGKIRLDPVIPEVGRPYLRARTTVEALGDLVLTEDSGRRHENFTD